MQHALREALEQQTATAEILRVISHSPTDIQPVLDAVVVSATKLCEAYDAWIGLREEQLIRVRAHHGPIRIFRDVRPLDRGRVSERAVIDRAVVHVHDLAASAAEFPLGHADALKAGHRTTLGVPLLREGEAIGVILIRRLQVRPFTAKQISLLQTFADQAVIAIENVRLFRELQTSNRELTTALEQQTATSEILRAITHAPTDTQPVFDTIVRSAATLCHAAVTAVFLTDGQMVFVPANYGSSPEALGAVRARFPRPLDMETSGGAAILTRSVVHVPDIEEPSVGELVRQNVRRLGVRSLITVPMLREGVAVGAIGVYRREPGRFSSAEVTLLQTFADQAVIAIENVRLFKELAARNTELTHALDQQTATAEILGVISSSPTDIQPVFAALATSAARLCDAFDAAIHRMDGDVLRLVAHEGPIQPDAVLPLEQGTLAGHVIRERQAMQVADMQAAAHVYPVSSEFARNRGFRTILSVPLLRGAEVLGVITIRRTEVRPFTDKQAELLKTFADQAVIAIENVRLFKELEARNRDLTETLEQQTATAEILRVISASPTDLQPVLETVAANAARVCGAIDAQIYRVEGEFLHWVASHGPIPPNTEERLISRGWVTGRAVVDRRTIHVHDLAAESDTEYPVGKAAQRVTGHRTTLATPLLREGVPLGVISIRRMEVRPFSEKQVRLLETFADQAVIAIENVRLFKELEARNRDLTATGEILRVISTSPTDVQPVFDTMVESAVRLCEARFGAVFLLENGLVHLAAHHNFNETQLVVLRAQYPMTPKRGHVSGRTILTGATVQIPDIFGDEEFRVAGAAGAIQTGFRSLLGVPMLRGGRAIGAIVIYRTESGEFADKHVELLKTFADQAVIAIENVRLFKELEARTAALTRSVEQLTALGEVGRAVSSTLNLETVLTTIVSRAVQLSGLDGGVVFEYDEGAEEFIQRVATETGGALAEARRTTRIRKGEGALGRTAITLEPVQVPDITVPGAYESRLRENLIESGIRAILAVPMVREGQLIGCLGVTRNQPGDFPAETIELLRTFATQSALAIQNARLFHEIADKSRQLEAASRHKSEFLANMSHELRTPLNAVIGFSEVLLQQMFGPLNVKQDEYLKDIYASGQHLLSLINDILDLSKIEAGRMDLAPVPFHLPSALENAVTLVKERASRHGIAVQLDLDPRLGEIVGDERKVKQVLLNLLSNAVKFTPEGGRITLKAGRTDGMVEISVTDTGIGIAPEDQAAIFEEFRQVGTDERKREGTGLGLTLAKKFVELHGGRIWVESEPGRGSTFTFTLPVS